MRTKTFLNLIALLGMLGGPTQATPLGTAITYQGRLNVGPDPANGIYELRLGVYDALSGPSLVGGPVTNSAVNVSNGLFTVTADFGSGVFTGGARWLEIGVRTNGDTAFTPLSPRQPLLAGPYALWTPQAGGVADASVTSAALAGSAVTSEKIAFGQVVKSLNDLKDQVTLSAGANISLTPGANDIEIAAGGSGWLRLAGAGANGSSGGITFGSWPSSSTYISESEDDGLYLVAPLGVGIGPGNVGIHVASLAAATHALTVANGIVGDTNVLRLIGPFGTYQYGAQLNFGDSDYVFLQEDEDDRLRIHGSGRISLTGGNVGIGTTIPQQKLDVDFGDIIVQGPGSCDANGEAGTVYLGTVHHYIKGEYGFGVKIGTYAVGDVIQIRELTGNVGIGTNAPQAKLHVAGTTRTSVLEITGGSDLAEPFEVSDLECVPQGAVLVIDDENPGRLRLSDRAYDKRVAGVISGAGGLSPGLTLHQHGLTDKGVQVALSGRVYVLADASHGVIRPGDQLTTSPTTGYAMKVGDYTKAQGAILGKAMSPLETGKGLVLVLVTLQ